MESSIAVFLLRQFAYEQLPMQDRGWCMNWLQGEPRSHHLCCRLDYAARVLLQVHAPFVSNVGRWPNGIAPAGMQEILGSIPTSAHSPCWGWCFGGQLK